MLKEFVGIDSLPGVKLETTVDEEVRHLVVFVPLQIEAEGGNVERQVLFYALLDLLHQVGDVPPENLKEHQSEAPNVFG